MAKKLLLIDDSRTARKLVKRNLPPEWEVEITEAGGGAEAMDLLAEQEFDVIFLDLTMPEVDGYSVLTWLKDNGKKTPVIVVSGDFQPKSGARVMNLGAFDFVKKPTQQDKMREVLRLAGVL